LRVQSVAPVLDPLASAADRDATVRRFPMGAVLVLVAFLVTGAVESAVALSRQPAGYAIALVALLTGAGAAAARIRRPVGTLRSVIAFALLFFAYVFLIGFALEVSSAVMLRQRVPLPIAFAVMLALLGSWLMVPVVILGLVHRRRRTHSGNSAGDIAPDTTSMFLGAAFALLALIVFCLAMWLSPPGAWWVVGAVSVGLLLPVTFRPLWIWSYRTVMVRRQSPEPLALRERLDDLQRLTWFQFECVICLPASFGNGKTCFVLLGSRSSTLVISTGAVDLLTPDQLLAVLTHEAAHAILNHGNRKLAWGGFATAAFIGVSLIGQISLGAIAPPSLGFFRVLVVMLPLVFMRQLYDHMVTRRHEAEADAFATRLVGTRAMLGALAALRGPNASEPLIHNRWTTHGTWERRVARIRKYGAKATDVEEA
jgi:Zn-dependent protease with chaperone function